MPEETKHEQPSGPRMECTEFETLLGDAIDGAVDGAIVGEAMGDDGYSGLSPARKERFEAHRRVCGVCGPLFADVQAGQSYLRSLEAVEPPAYMVQNILMATSGVVSRGADDSGERAGAGMVGFVLYSGDGFCAAASVCDVVWDDLLLVFAGAERVGSEGD